MSEQEFNRIAKALIYEKTPRINLIVLTTLPPCVREFWDFCMDYEARGALDELSSVQLALYANIVTYIAENGEGGR